MVIMETRPLLILVGLTGTGKTTTVKALQQAGLDFLLLPDRRELTDRFIIQYLQELDGEPVALVTDRRERFAYTRRYRELHPGGMAEALNKFLVISNQYSVIGHQVPFTDDRLLITDNRFLIFDGLRGENEITHAVDLFPQAWFLFLHAPDFVRVQRLVRRQDAFDAVSVGCDKDTAVLRELASGILTTAETEQFLALAASGDIAADELQAKLTIVRSEKQNYNPDATLASLQHLAPDRLIFGDTTACSPEEIANLVMGQLKMI